MRCRRKKKTGEQPVVLLVSEAARRLRVSEMHVIGLIETGELDAIDIGARSRHHWRIVSKSFDAYQQRRSSRRTEVNR